MHPGNDPSSQWHAIRPWRPTLSLSVREITSVSATFNLSSPLAANASHSDSSLDNDDEPDRTLDNDQLRQDNNNNAPTASDSTSRGGRQSQIISDALSKGLSVKVNGTPWQRVLMKIDDEVDEAVIILFGLMPSRQYDVELGIVPGENAIRGQITTAVEPSSRAEPDSSHGSSVNDNTLSTEHAHPLGQSTSMASTQSGSSGSHAHSPSPTPPPTFSLEDRRMQLTHTLNLLTTEHTTLTASLKSARREAQKADAALRAEIDTLKRASEKHAGLEHRAKQKVLALQEAVRRTIATTEEIKQMIVDVEAVLPGLEEKRREVEEEYKRVSHQADAVRDTRNEVENKERKRVEGMQNELASLGNRMERLNTRKEKLEGEGGVLSELEEKLRKLEEERLKVENDPYGYGEDEYGDGSYGDEGPQPDGRSGSSDTDDQAFLSSPQHPSHPHTHHHGQNHHHTPRKRHSHPVNQRSPQQPIQRPSHNSRLSLPAGPGVIHINPTNPLHPPHIPTHSHSHSHPHNPKGQFQHPTSSSASSSSNLSKRAPPFEPSGIARRSNTVSSSTSNATSASGSNSATGTATKSELNPGSSPFSPRLAVSLASSQASSSPTPKRK